MDKFVINGGIPLRGEIPTNGSKNSALPALAAALLTEEPVVLRRIPRVRDIRTMQRLLVDIGSKAEVEDETIRLTTPQIVCPEAPYELVKTMRASSLVLGPLVGRVWNAEEVRSPPRNSDHCMMREAVQTQERDRLRD